MHEKATTTTTGKQRIRHIGGTRYLIESRSEPGVGRQVDTLHLRCSCPAGRNNRRCYHLAWALQFEGWRKHEQAKAASWGSAPPTAASWGSTPARATGMQALQEAFA